MDEASFVVTEENFHIAYNNAGPLARKRLNAKMEKKKMRGGAWQPFPLQVQRTSHVKGYVQKEYLPCADLEQYVKRFVMVHCEKTKTLS